MERVTVKAAASRLGIPEFSLRALMEQGRINIGYVKRNKSRNTYYIIEKLLDEEAKRTGR